MAKRSQRRPSRHEKSQAGCIWGLIRVFDFRQGRSTRRLLSDRRRESKQEVGAGHSNTQKILPVRIEKSENVVDVQEMLPVADAAAKTSVKQLMAVEMFNEHGSTNRPNDSEITLEQISSKHENHSKKNQKSKNRNRVKSCDVDASKLDPAECLPENFDRVPEIKPLDNLDQETVMKELARISQRNTNCLKNDFRGTPDVSYGLDVTIVEEKLVAALKVILEERLRSSKHLGEEGNAYCSKEFMDALQTLNSNKGLFLKLLQDQNSVLVKHIQNLEDARVDKDPKPSSLPACNLSGGKPANSKSGESSSRKHRSFFRRSKSLESYPLVGEKDCLSPNKIVILKPGPAGAQSPETDVAISSSSLHSHYMEVHNDRNTSQFSFTEIKRKLRHAMGKERQGISSDRATSKLSSKHHNMNKSSSGENSGWSSPNRNHFYTEKFAKYSPSVKKGEPVGKLKDKGSGVLSETSLYPRIGGSDFYTEAKKHLSDMLRNGDENTEAMTGQLPKSLGRILSFTQYNGSPCCSPRKYGDDVFITAQTRLSPRGMVKNNMSGGLQESHDNHPSPRKQNLESQPCISGSNTPAKVQSHGTDANNIPPKDNLECSLEVQSFTQDTLVPEVQTSSLMVPEIEEMTESRSQEEENIISISSESSSNSVGGEAQEGDCREVENEERASQFSKESSPCFKSDSFGEDQILSSLTVSPYSPVSREVEDSDYATDKMGRPSPISVLEPILTDDDISPASTKPQPVEKGIQPVHIHFEEQPSATEVGICTRISLEDEESAFEYVEAVLLGSGLNWGEFLPRWLSSCEILDSSLFNEVELFSGRPRHDQKLLFDCANKALKKVCESYFRCVTGISHLKPNIQSVPKGMDLIHEVWKRVEGHLFQHPHSYSLDQLVEIDLVRSGKWMKLQSNSEHIGFEMEEIIFNELVEDIVVSFINNTSECEFAVLGDESKGIEDTNLIQADSVSSLLVV